MEKKEAFLYDKLWYIDKVRKKTLKVCTPPAFKKHAVEFFGASRQLTTKFFFER